MELTPEIRAELKAKYGEDAFALTGPNGKLVFRRPTQAEWERFHEALVTDKKSHNKTVSIRALATACAVWPSMAEAVAAFEIMAGLPDAALAEFSVLMGTTQEAEKL